MIKQFRSFPRSQSRNYYIFSDNNACFCASNSANEPLFRVPTMNVSLVNRLSKNVRFIVALSLSLSLSTSAYVNKALAENKQTVVTQKSTDGLGVSYTNISDTELQVRIDGAKTAPKLDVLTNPERIVIDVPGVTAPKGKDVTNISNQMISGVRFGNHPGLSRVVLDVKEGVTLSPSVKQQGASYIVSLKTSEPSLARPDLQALSPAAKIAPDTTTEESDTTRLTSAKTGSEVARLTEVEISKGKRAGNMIVARLSKDTAYDFHQTAPSEYVLTIKGATFSPNAITSQVAAPSAGSIRSVRPVAQGSDVLLRVFAKPESSLLASMEDNTIYISEENNFSDDMLIKAQANPLKAEEQASKEEETKDDSVAAGGKAEVKDGSSSKAISNGDLSSLLGGDSIYSGRLISLDLQDTDIDNALRIIAEVSNLNIIASDDVTGKVTLRLIDVPWDQALDVILKTNGLDKVQEGNVVRIAPIERLRQERESLKQAQQAEEELEPLQVKYIRVSYAKASSIKPILDSVITERGNIAFDERTNQVIVKDIRKGIKNVVELLKKLDLRTPQVLLETHIVEASRTFSREFGSELGGSFIQSPETGNATGKNFPNSVSIGGTNTLGQIGGPAQISSFAGGGASLGMIFDSADGSRSLSTRLTALEREGVVKVTSKPSVATTNNTQAVIENVRVLRVRQPSGGQTVQTGAGASSGGSSSATEQIRLGIKLTVTPQASPDYFVLLDVAAESSSLDPDRVEVDGIPSTVERKANSSVLVSSGQTFVLGGIYRINDATIHNGIPFLKDVPVLGAFFGGTNVSDTDEELLFFITPRIVEGSFDDASMKLSS